MESKTIILSIHPNHIDKILSGEKRYEYRKRIPQDINYLIVYATAPTKKEDIVKLYNTAASVASTSKPGYKKSNDTVLSNLNMGALAKISAVRDTVGNFLGEGSTSETVKKGSFDGKKLVKSTLKASDVIIKEFSRLIPETEHP